MPYVIFFDGMLNQTTEWDKEEAEVFLDAFYKKYESVFMQVWREGITTRNMMEKLSNNYPTLYENIEREFVAKTTDPESETGSDVVEEGMIE